MANLHPNQPMPFAIHPFRTSVKLPSSPEKLNVLVEKLKNRYGKAIHVSGYSKQRLHLTLHPSSGYLLGENIWYALDKPSNLIYCEALPTSFQASQDYQLNGQHRPTLPIRVRVHEGHGYFDGKIPIHAVWNELLPLARSSRRYNLVLHGQLPFSSEHSPFHKAPGHTFKQLGHSLLCDMQLKESLQLSHQKVKYPWTLRSIQNPWQILKKLTTFEWLPFLIKTSAH
mgnify:CR=1 FL=1